MNAHKRITFFAYHQNSLVFNIFDNIDGLLPLVLEFMAGFDDKECFLCHDVTLPKKWRFGNPFSVQGIEGSDQNPMTQAIKQAGRPKEALERDVEPL
jgi:hypothetical protein